MTGPGGDSYRKAGVDRLAAAAFIERISAAARSTHTGDVVGGIGGFAGMMRLPSDSLPGSLLVACADGVGTKLMLAETLGNHRGIGVDLVAMNVNDMVTCGARPLAFLDYIATGGIDPAGLAVVVESMADGCRQAGCVLLGGETAEMPGFYEPGRYDLAGFAVGIVREEDLVDGSAIRPGDLVVGLASTGAHSNGYSLVRRIVDDAGLDLAAVHPPMAVPLGEALLAPTRIYVPLVLDLAGRFAVRGMAHITGGGLIENVPRILPAGCRIVVDPASWPEPGLFTLLRERGGVDRREMYRVFNMGIGFVVVAAPDVARAIQADLAGRGERSWIIGEVIAGERGLDVAGVA